MQFDDAKQLGAVMGCLEMDISPDELNAISGCAQMWDRHGEPAQRLLLKAANDLLCSTGLVFTAPAFHIRTVLETPWSVHSRELAEDVVRTSMAMEQLDKQASAIPQLLETGGSALKGLGYTSLGAGAGLGSLYWMLSRHANQEDADNEAKKHQVEHYERLSRELQDSMRRKYRYTLPPEAA